MDAQARQNIKEIWQLKKFNSSDRSSINKRMSGLSSTLSAATANMLDQRPWDDAEGRHENGRVWAVRLAHAFDSLLNAIVQPFFKKHSSERKIWAESKRGAVCTDDDVCMKIFQLRISDIQQ